VSTGSPNSFLRRSPVAAYFLLTFLISWSAAFAITAHSFVRGQALPKLVGLLIFPAMLVGPCISGILLTWLIDGRDGLHNLFARLRRWRVASKWYALLLLPPELVLLVLFLLKSVVSTGFAPNKFYIGILFGIPAGVFEEIGWMGYAYPKMVLKWSPLKSAIVLGLLWSLWHLPAINFLGASAPHGSYWFAFFLAFSLAMTAIRVLICWQYSHTNSVLLAQFMHISSTGTLVVFSPPVSPSHETMWYAIYGGALWVVVGMIAAKRGRELRVDPRNSPPLVADGLTTGRSTIPVHKSFRAADAHAAR